MKRLAINRVDNRHIDRQQCKHRTILIYFCGFGLTYDLANAYDVLTVSLSPDAPPVLYAPLTYQLAQCLLLHIKFRESLINIH